MRHSFQVWGSLFFLMATTVCVGSVFAGTKVVQILPVLNWGVGPHEADFEFACDALKTEYLNEGYGDSFIYKEGASVSSVPTVTFEDYQLVYLIGNPHEPNVVFIAAHGFPNESIDGVSRKVFASEFVDDWDSCMDRHDHYDDLDWDEFHLDMWSGWDSDPAVNPNAVFMYGMALDGQGISTYLTSVGLPANTIFLGGYCYSEDHRGDWGGSGISFNGYTNKPTYEQIWWGWVGMSNRMMCVPVTVNGNPMTLNTTSLAVNGPPEFPGQYTLAPLVNNDTTPIFLKPKSGIKNDGCYWLDAGIEVLGKTSSELVFVGKKKSPFSSFNLLIDGVLFNGSQTNSGLKDSFGRELYVFEIGLSGMETIEVVDIVFESVKNSSGQLRVQEIENIFLSDFADEAESGVINDQSYKFNFDSDSRLTGVDVVVASRSEEFCDGVGDKLTELGYQVAFDYNYHYDVADVQTLYGAAVDFNATNNYHPSPGTYYPVLYIVGTNADPGGIPYPVNPDSAEDECFNTCFSDFLFTDITGNNVPNGPVSRIPGASIEDFEYIIQSGADYGTEQYSDPYNRISYICDDDDYSWALSLQHVAAVNSSLDYLNRNILYSSNVPAQSQYAAIRDQINDGLVELWGFGWTNPQKWTDFLETSDNLSELTTEQIFVGYVPTCQTAFFGSLSDHSLIKSFLFPQGAQKTKAAGFVGHLVGGWDVPEYLMLREIADAKLQFVGQAPFLAEISFHAVISFIEKYPMFKNHALGLGTIGGPVRLGALQEATHASSFVRSEPIQLSSMNLGGRVKVQYVLGDGVSGEGKISIYNIRGQKVADFSVGMLQGTGEFFWDGRDSNSRPVGSGTYLALVVIRNNEILRGVEKVTILK